MKKMNGKIVYWKMQNGHRHSFYTECEDWHDDDNIPDGYFFRDGREVKTQGDYFEYVCESEHTYVEVLDILDYTEEGVREAIDLGYVRLSGSDEPLLELAGLEGLEFI